MSAVAKASDPKGLKRVCASCGIRFYDLNKRPIACPNCSTEFTGDIKVKTRRSRVTTEDAVIEKKGKKTSAQADDEDEDLEVEDADVVSLEDLEDDGDADDDDDTPDADLDLDADLEDLEEIDDDLEDLDEDIDVEDEEKPE